MSIRRIFGEDIFISYARKDSSTYATGLAEQLTKRGFSCFIDRLGSEANQVLPNSLRRKIRNATMLVVIGTKWSGTRDSIRDEIAEFKRTKRTIVPVDLDGSIYDAVWYNEIEGIAPEPEKNLQALDDGNPSLAVLSRIEKAFRYLRRNQRLRFMTIGMVTILVLLLAISAYAGRKAASELARAERARQEADDQRRIADEQTKAAEEAKKQAQQALRDADKQKKIADAKTEEAKQQSKIADESLKEAHRQQQIAATQRAAAERQSKISVGLSLASEGKKEFEANPMLGLRLGLEALSQLPEDDVASRKAVEESIRTMSAQGRVMKLGGDAFETPTFIKNSQLFVLVRAEGPSELRRSDTGELVQTLPDKAVEVSQPERPAPVPYFMLKYEHAPGEVRRGDTGEVVASGKVKEFLNLNIFGEVPFAVVEYEDAPDQLLPTDRWGLPIALSGRLQSIQRFTDAPWMLFSYHSNQVELRRLDLKLAATYPDVQIWGRQLPKVEASSDRSLFCVKGLVGDDYSGYDWAELRRADSGELVSLTGKVRDVVFSPRGPYFIVAYSDAPGEVRRTDSNQIVRLPKLVKQAAFGQHSTAFLVRYDDKSGEMYLAPEAEPISLRGPIEKVEPEENVPYLKVTHSLLLDVEYLNERTGARINPSPAQYYKQSDASLDDQSKFVALAVYRDQKKFYELHRRDLGEIVTLPQSAVQITFLKGTPYLLIVYEGGRCELRRIDDGSVIPVAFTAFVPQDRPSEEKPFARIEFSPDLTTFVIYDDHKGAIFRAPTGEKLGELSEGQFVSPFMMYFSADSTRLLTTYTSHAPELRRTDTGAVIQQLTDEIDPRPSYSFFSPDSTRLVVTYQNHAPELRRSDTAAVIKQLSDETDAGKLEGVFFNKQSTFFTAQYYGGSMELVRADNGEVLAPLVGGARLSSVQFSPSGDYAVLTFADNRAELWNTAGVPRRVIELNRNLTSFRFDEPNNQLMVWHSDKRAYILDLRWISNMTSGSGRVPFERLIQSSCEAYKHHPLPLGILERYLVGESPRVCQ
jgi:hypothetical protein